MRRCGRVSLLRGLYFVIILVGGSEASAEWSDRAGLELSTNEIQ